MTDHLIERFQQTYENTRWTTKGRTITTTDILGFAGVSGDFAELHVNEEFARATSYGHTIAHGLLTLTITTTLASSLHVIPGRASYGYDRIRFVAPVLPGDTLSVVVTVGGYRQRPDGLGTVALSYETVNQRQETVMVCSHVLLISLEDVFPH
jgi:acyl dehydratase